jgi:hypothetical protein
MVKGKKDNTLNTRTKSWMGGATSRSLARSILGVTWR